MLNLDAHLPNESAGRNAEGEGAASSKDQDQPADDSASLPFGAGILSQPSENSGRGDGEPERPDPQAVSDGNSGSVSADETQPGPEGTGMEERDSEEDISGTREPKGKTESQKCGAGEESESKEFNYDIIEPPDGEDEPDGFENIPPGPMQEVRFDDYSSRRSGRSGRRGRGQRREAPAAEGGFRIIRWIKRVLRIGK